MPKLVFGGGTCIWKILKGDRFSEDIDAYSSNIPEDLSEYLRKEFSLLGADCNILKKKRTSNMLFLKLSLSFPSHPREITMSVEILYSKNQRSEPKTLYSPYPDIPPIELSMLSPEELLANKVSAIYERNKSRDVHDLHFLLKSGIQVNANFVLEKTPKFNLKTFKQKIMEKQKEWKSLGTLIVTKLPPFKEEIDFILSEFGKLPWKG